MSEKRSFLEIVNNQLLGKWYYDGLIVECLQDVFEIYPLYENKITDVYTVTDITAPLFVKVIRREFQDAIKELDNKRIIRSLFYKESNGIKVKGGNIFEQLEDGKIRMNKNKIFNNFDEILELNIISKEEKINEWLVF